MYSIAVWPKSEDKLANVRTGYYYCLVRNSDWCRDDYLHKSRRKPPHLLILLGIDEDMFVYKM